MCKGFHTDMATLLLHDDAVRFGQHCVFSNIFINGYTSSETETSSSRLLHCLFGQSLQLLHSSQSEITASTPVDLKFFGGHF